VIIYFKEFNIFHAGDVFVRYGLPFIDAEHGGSIDGMLNANKLLASMLNDSSIVIPGHGNLSKKQDVDNFTKMLQTIRTRIYKQMQSGKTLDQIIANDPTREFKEGMKRKDFVKVAYDSLKDKLPRKK
jgi:glyoxylase-like metal-dependent hydrolase (beta-lactamase superfamily II)